jgi:hypothetical protein
LHRHDHQHRAGHARGRRGVEAGEQPALQRGERAEQQSGGGDQPHLVAEEERAQGVEGQPAPALGGRAGEQHADAVVVAGQRQVRGEEQAEQQVPGKLHGDSLR